MQKYDVAWTKKTSLNASRDPLGLRSLKKLEDYFLHGITTQTPRLRYYSFLTWAYKRMRDQEITIRRLLSMEKMVTLITRYNHQEDNTIPYGTRNTESASDFLRRKRRERSINIEEYRNFGYGGNNRIGYGTYYYRNPLAVLHIVWTDDEKRIFHSQVGEAIADLMENIPGNNLLLSDKITKTKLATLHSLCLCSDAIRPNEREIWRAIFFGFTSVSRENYLEFDKESLKKFQNGQLTFFQRPEEWYRFGSNALERIDPRTIFHLKTVGRRGTLLMIMKVIENVEPNASDLDQVVRDALYFKQFLDSNDTVKEISFGKLESLRTLWEVYVHNLYFISVLEEAFAILLEMLEKKPVGVSLSDIVSSLNVSSINKEIKGVGFRPSTMENLLEQLASRSPSKTNLRTRPNERECFMNGLQAETKEAEFANLLVLLCLLKYRYSHFTKAQLEVLRYSEEKMQSLTPTQFYKDIMRGDIDLFIRRLLDLLVDRHKLIAAIKYESGTRFWLFTEEDGVLFHYGKPYDFRAYRESKWRNVVELLCDMGLIQKVGKALKVSKVGRSWLQKIK